ncbi:MAG: RNA-binding cell elongation regulator Jag/EloR [Actinomycetota bacterium]|nr:RNA-binding cell elongation regulator Jag/EloR [Actinomycetota bacterium]
MKRETIGEGPTTPEALDAALEELGVQQDAVEYEVLEEGGRRLFGMGTGKTARVRVWLKGAFVAELDQAKQEPRETVDAEEPDVPSGRDEAGPVEKLSDEDLDKVADKAANSIQEILKSFDIEASVEEYEGDEGEIILDIVGDDLGVLIGRHGKTLDAFQTLVAAATNRALGFRHPVVVDVEGYRHRRRAKLEEIGKRASDKAARTGQAVKLRPMSSYERRVIHVFLRDDQRVVTASEGDEPFRQVVVNPK